MRTIYSAGVSQRAVPSQPMEVTRLRAIGKAFNHDGD